MLSTVALEIQRLLIFPGKSRALSHTHAHTGLISAVNEVVMQTES